MASDTDPSKEHSASQTGARKRGRPRKDLVAPAHAASIAPLQRRQAKPAPATPPPLAAVGDDDRQFIGVLARGMEVLAAFRAGDQPLGNDDLVKRTGLPSSTVSRITHTLTRLGYLVFNRRNETYELGGGVLSLGYVAQANLDIRRLALPFMRELAEHANFGVSLGIRNRLMMMYVELVTGQALVGVRLAQGSRVPLATTAMGRAYLAALPKPERDALLEELKPRFGADWPMIVGGVERAVQDIARRGFCVSIGEWHKDINGAATPIVNPRWPEIYVLDLGGPAYMLPERELIEQQAPRLVEAARSIIALAQGGAALADKNA